MVLNLRIYLSNILTHFNGLSILFGSLNIVLYVLMYLNFLFILLCILMLL